MVIQAERDRVRQLLRETLPTLCRSGLSSTSDICVEALIGVTLNKHDVFIVSIKETLQSEDDVYESRDAAPDDNVVRLSKEEILRSKRKWRRQKRKKQESETSIEDDVISKHAMSPSKLDEEGNEDVQNHKSGSDGAGVDFPEDSDEFSDEEEVRREDTVRHDAELDGDLELPADWHETSQMLLDTSNAPSHIKQEPNKGGLRAQESESKCETLAPAAQATAETSFNTSEISSGNDADTKEEEMLSLVTLAEANISLGDINEATLQSSMEKDSENATQKDSPEPATTKDKKKKRTFKCKLCSYTTTHSGNLARHRQTHTGKKYQCDTCDSLYASKSVLLQHYKLVHGSPLLCTCCSKPFRSHSGLALHMKRQRGEFLYRCDICDKGFIEKGSYEGHLSKHAALSPYACEQCGRSYRYKCSYAAHKKECKGPVNRSEPAEIRCSCCEKKFNTKGSLKEHMIAKHSSKAYKCDRCFETFQWRPSYNRHVKSCSK